MAEQKMLRLTQVKSQIGRKYDQDQTLSPWAWAASARRTTSSTTSPCAA